MPDKRLGAGLDALLGPAPNDPYTTVREIALDQIRPNPFQPRTQFPAEEIERLAESIRAAGVLQPIAVRPQNGAYEIICGERRWRAARVAGLAAIPTVVRRIDDSDMLLYALAENIQREDLDPLEKARAFHSAVQQLGSSHEQLATLLGYDRSTVTNYLRLLELPAEVQEAVSRGTITMGHARVLAGVTPRTRQIELLQRIVREVLSVRATERIAREAAGRPPKPSSRSADPVIADLERRLADYFGTRVRIASSGKGGRILIEYYEPAQFNSILGRLGLV